MSNPVGSVPAPNDSLRGRGYGTGATDFANNNPTMISPLAQSAHGYGELGAAQAEGGADAYRSASTASTTVGGSGVSRNNTLKKRTSVRRTGSLKRSGSRRSMKAGSIKGVNTYDDGDYNSAFFTPIPTSGSPTEALADRFQAWRQLLKSLITYFREIQNSYEVRAKALHKVQNTISNISHPAVFMNENGLGEATRILDDFHKRSIAEANKSRDIEDDVIGALTGLRSDLGQKIKEIKSLNGDFKNSVEKEKDLTRKEVEKLQDALANSSFEDASGKNDPYVVRLGVDRAIEKQIDEENYLHRAYLNLESSGRELESIVVGEIQKAYNALAGILKREGDDAYNAVESLRTGPVSMPKDQEWYQFVSSDEHFVDPSIPLRRIEDITYPGKNHPAASEIRAGMLERKSKYLKSYTPGWYVLSPTHLHEFKSADKIYSQPPVMSLYLPDQKLGSHSETGSSSHKFMLKGKQSGGLHKGHNWVFRAESQETMLAWFEDIKNLTEKTGEERIAFVRQHARSVSGQSDRATVSSDGMDEDEADQTPYSTDVATYAEPVQRVQRPQAGGRFPSDLALRTIGSRAPADDTDDEGGAAIAAAAAPLASSAAATYGGRDPYRLEGVDTGSVPDDELAVPEQKVFKQDTPVTVFAPTAAVASAQPSAPVAAPAPSVSQQYPQAVPAPSAQHLQDLVTGPSPTVPTPADSATATNSGNDSASPIAAAALGGAGLGALASSGLHERSPQVEQDRAISEPASTISGEPIVPPVGLIEPVDGPASSANPVSSLPISSADLATPIDADATPLATVTSSGLGGNERQGAHVTGSFFPSVVRHDTDISVSRLHVPGEFPKGK